LQKGLNNMADPAVTAAATAINPILGMAVQGFSQGAGQSIGKPAESSSNTIAARAMDGFNVNFGSQAVGINWLIIGAVGIGGLYLYVLLTKKHKG
jgi:hypothetical protein